MRTVDLGDGLTVSAQGLGCMGMSEFYGETDWDAAIDTIHRALDLGVTFIDTADIYGAGHNEVLVGRGIAGRRDEVQLATKFGIDRMESDSSRRIRGEPEYVQRSCDGTLLRLGVDVIDLYYLHRPPETAEIEETVGRWPTWLRRERSSTSGCRRWTTRCCAEPALCIRLLRCRANTRCGLATPSQPCSKLCGNSG